MKARIWGAVSALALALGASSEPARAQLSAFELDAVAAYQQTSVDSAPTPANYGDGYGAFFSAVEDNSGDFTTATFNYPAGAPITAPSKRFHPAAELFTRHRVHVRRLFQRRLSVWHLHSDSQ